MKHCLNFLSNISLQQNTIYQKKRVVYKLFINIIFDRDLLECQRDHKECVSTTT